MGKYRSKSGCLTCRNRRVKCDEVHPVCGQCSKKNRDCQWESAHSKFRSYRPDASSSGTTPGEQGEDEGEDVDMEDEDAEPSASSTPYTWGDSRSGRDSATTVAPSGAATAGMQQSSTSPFLTSVTSPSTTSSVGGVPVPVQFSEALPRHDPVSLTRQEAMLVHHYAEYLGRWLDGTDPARQFSLRIPVQVKYCPILLYSVLCFSARHLGENSMAETAYQHCIALLIERLNLNTAMYDEDLLCAIVILRFFEQLNVSTITLDHEQHLAGSSAILRASQSHFVDPTAPTLREAAFWVYVRQSLFNATVNQQPPDVDFSLELEPKPATLRDSHPLAMLRLETAWSNQMTWHCACVVNFCYDSNGPFERSHRAERWEELQQAVQQWGNTRPANFDPVWSGPTSDGGAFPEMWFIADWHVVSFGYFHFSCIMLLHYKPGPKFAMRRVGSNPTDVDNQILEHARAICGSCKSNPATVPCLITLCHTIFIWGPLISDPAERNEVLQILADFERSQKWPTKWIVHQLKDEWGVDHND